MANCNIVDNDRDGNQRPCISQGGHTDQHRWGPWGRTPEVTIPVSNVSSPETVPASKWQEERDRAVKAEGDFKYQEKQFAAAVELNTKQERVIDDLRERLEKYEEPGPKCNSGHVNNLPLKLWTCPMCDEKRLRKIIQLRKVRQTFHEKIVRLEVELERLAKENELFKLCVQRGEEVVNELEGVAGVVEAVHIETVADLRAELKDLNLQKFGVASKFLRVRAAEYPCQHEQPTKGTCTYNWMTWVAGVLEAEEKKG